MYIDLIPDQKFCLGHHETCITSNETNDRYHAKVRNLYNRILTEISSSEILV